MKDHVQKLEKFWAKLDPGQKWTVFVYLLGYSGLPGHLSYDYEKVVSELQTIAGK